MRAEPESRKQPRQAQRRLEIHRPSSMDIAAPIGATLPERDDRKQDCHDGCHANGSRCARELAPRPTCASSQAAKAGKEAVGFCGRAFRGEDGLLTHIDLPRLEFKAKLFRLNSAYFNFTLNDLAKFISSSYRAEKTIRSNPIDIVIIASHNPHRLGRNLRASVIFR